MGFWSPVDMFFHQKKPQQPQDSQAQRFDLATEPQQPVRAAGRMAAVATVLSRNSVLTLCKGENVVPT